MVIAMDEIKRISNLVLLGEQKPNAIDDIDYAFIISIYKQIQYKGSLSSSQSSKLTRIENSITAKGLSLQPYVYEYKYQYVYNPEEDID